MNPKNLEKLTRAYALKNALAYNGKANQGSVISSLFHEGLKKEELKNHIKTISKIVSEVNSLSIQQQKEEFEKSEKIVSERKGREGLSDLPNVPKSGIVMRFAPSASGPLHVGHAIAVSLSYLYVKKYGGKLYIRIEDTNPDNIYPKAYKMISDDSKWLCDKKSKIMIQSDRMKIYYKYAENLIKKKATYICTCSPEEFEKYVEAMKNCPCRNLSVKENLEKWKKMLDKSKNGFKQGDAVLRFKSDMRHPNPAMRDFPLARINLTKHPKQKNKFKVWPLMNLAVIVDDIETKVTHTIRGKDHVDNAKKQEMIYKVLGKKSPWNAFIGRLKFKDMELSTTKMRRDIESGIYSGWDDPKLPTLISLKKQKYRPSAFWKFAERIGLSEVDKVIDKKEFFTLLNSFNK
ncbi:glutamate--tRNA ligase [Candidatus Pacearchaeota archaeon]|nr:glutamate--tRNA ligase [Candidatus Pacearchaeota archaeon]